MRWRVLSWVVGVTVALVMATAAAASAKVLLVGSFHGIHGKYSSLQAAVNAAKPGDWILVGPGDYKTSSSREPAGRTDTPAAVLITKPGLHIRGMNRNTVIIDGTTGGAACNAKTRFQNFGPKSKLGRLGLNGIMVWKADNVSVQNLTACNFLGGAGDVGNGIWWNGGDGSGKIGGWGYLGSYLTATSTYFHDEKTAATYGIFSSNWDGGTWDQTYASNFNDSGYYIGACQQICNQTLNHGWAENNALGYSGSNSGGWLLIENSQFDNNQDGFDTNSQNGDNPPPQDGACPAGVKPPIKGAPSCWVFYKNNVHDNNNPNVPAAGSASAGPVGTGMSISGGHWDTVMDNTFKNNNAWGIVLVPYSDSGTSCPGGTPNFLGSGTCFWDDYGNAVLGNSFAHNGSFGHPTNGDIAWVNLQADPAPCFSGNTEPGGKPATTSPLLAQTVFGSCSGQTTPPNGNAAFLSQVLCDAQFNGPGTASCPPGVGPYPRATHIRMRRLPKHLKTMPNPCAGVPKTPWCRAGKPI